MGGCVCGALCAVLLSGIPCEFFVLLRPDEGGAEAVIEPAASGGGQEATTNEMQGPERVKQATVRHTLRLVELEHSALEDEGACRERVSDAGHDV